jgi:hypothetical protein
MGSQVLPVLAPTDAVHRLNGSRLVLCISLRYSRVPSRGGRQEELSLNGIEGELAGDSIILASAIRQGVFTLLSEQPLVAGFRRSFPQDSCRSLQFCQVKRMIRGTGDETSSTYSQTLNRQDVVAT